MGKKSNKRQIESDSNENPKIGIKDNVNNDSPKKKFKKGSEKSKKIDESNVAVKKIHVKSTESQNATNKLDIKSANNANGGTLKIKKGKKQQNSADIKTTAPDSKSVETEISRRKQWFKQKRIDYKEKVKLLGRQGVAASMDKLSVTELKKRIADIASRDTISKTAKRKLAILKKKLEIRESGVESVDKKDSSSTIISKNENKKNKLQNKVSVKNENLKKGTEKKNKKDKAVAKELKKNLFIEDREGNTDLNDDSDEEENGSNNSNEKNNETQSSSEENVQEDIDESEDDSEEEADELDETVDESENEGSDEDSNEGENSSEKEEKDKPTSVIKIKNAKNKANQDSNKQKPKPTEQNPIKNRRYVLFVGNIAYDSTTVDVKKHFLTKVDKVKDVRIPTHPDSNKPRGFAYVEVENSEDYEKGLSLHNTFINGRKINVEYTASGSKKGNRNPEVIHKNKKLQALRKDGKLAGSQKFSQKRSFRRNFKNNPKKVFGKRES